MNDGFTKPLERWFFRSLQARARRLRRIVDDGLTNPMHPAVSNPMHVWPWRWT